MFKKNKKFLRTLQRRKAKKKGESKLRAEFKKKQRKRLQYRVEKLMKKFLPDIDLKLKKKKPVWSYTENEIQNLEKEKEDKILKFMDDLDCDDILDKIEVKFLLILI